MALAAEAQFHVLAVDDSLIDRKLIEKLLKTSSFQVTTVDSGSKALEFLGLRHDHGSPDQQEVEVNMVITDYWMPGMTGYDLLKKIKESSAFKNIPVVIMSSENVPARINRCLEEGAEEFLLKPVKLSDMKRLRPYILKWKSTEQQQRSNNHADLSTSCSNSATSDHSITSNSSSVNSTYGSSTKRKAMDEGLPPEKKRQRFSSNSGNSLTVL